MESHIVNIGNSRGIRIPAAFLKETGIDNLVEIIMEGKQIIIKKVEKPRKNWDLKFKKMHVNDDDKLLDDFLDTSFDNTEWDWDETI